MLPCTVRQATLRLAHRLATQSSCRSRIARPIVGCRLDGTAIRSYHSTPLAWEEEQELSAKEKKKLLKAKAKEMAAAAEAAKEAAGEEEDPLAAKQATLQAKKEAKASAAAVEQPEEGSTEVASPDPPKEDAASAEPEPEPPAEASSAPSELKQYSSPELTEDAAKHKAGLEDPERNEWENPLHMGDNKVFREDFASDEDFEAAVLPAPPLDGKPPEYLEAMAEEILNLTVLEMNELVNKIADHYGFHEGLLSPDQVDGGDEEEVVAAPVVEEKTAFDVKLVEFDAKAKIKVIKEIRAIAGLGLKEAKELVESAPKVIAKGLKKEEAEELKAKLEEIGATMEIV